MAKAWSRSERRLLVLVLVCAAVFVGDIILLNVAGELPGSLWIFAVPVGLLLVPVAGLVCLVVLFTQRRRQPLA